MKPTAEMKITETKAIAAKHISSDQETWLTKTIIGKGKNRLEKCQVFSKLCTVLFKSDSTAHVLSSFKSTNQRRRFDIQSNNFCCNGESVSL